MQLAKRDVPVGARVKVPARGSLRAGVVIEDRGHLGVHGEQILRVRVEVPIANEVLEIEVPIDWLKDVRFPRTRARKRAHK